MKIDQDYLKGLLEAFQAAEYPTTDINELKSLGFDYGEKRFIFHLQILSDMHLIESEDIRNGLGMKKGAAGLVCWSAVPLRLTVQGHSFIEALQNEDVWSSLKSGFKDASIETLVSASKSLLEGFVKKKINEYTGL